MKKLIIVILLIVFLWGISNYQETLLGASTVTYSCTDNNALSATPLQTLGTVTVVSSDAGRESFADYCLDQETLREYSCDLETGKHTYSDHLCASFGQRCKLGRCLAR